MNEVDPHDGQRMRRLVADKGIWFYMEAIPRDAGMVPGTAWSGAGAARSLPAGDTSRVRRESGRGVGRLIERERLWARSSVG